EELKFACGDGFWNTIAKGKSNKAEVDLLVKNYLRKGGQPNVANNSGTIRSVKEGYGLIHALIVIKNTSALQRIIHAGVNPHVLPLQGASENGVKENNDISPLVLAAQLGYMNGVRLLVERAHANVLSSKGPRQENALLAAIQADAFDVVTYLLQVSHQLLNQADMFGATPLHYACMKGKTKMISFLVRECDQAIDAVCYRGETPLHYAIRHRRAKAVAFLVGELGAYPNTYILKKIPTPLDLAKSKGLRNI
ncbi:ankyrin repeat-containing domain protein, partial [Absidia repens]